MREIRDAVAGLLESYTLATLCERTRQLAGGGEAPADYAI
jgi:DNA-binding IscR family transcriptional regulator